jgi:hypothetical protein
VVELHSLQDFEEHPVRAPKKECIDFEKYKSKVSPIYYKPFVPELVYFAL